MRNYVITKQEKRKALIYNLLTLLNQFTVSITVSFKSLVQKPISFSAFKLEKLEFDFKVEREYLVKRGVLPNKL